MSKMYKIRYLPSFYRDLDEVTSYISMKLGNNIAAQHLLTDVETEIFKRQQNPESTSRYISNSNRKNTYYRIYVKNYTVFYVVKDNTMEVRRFLYSRRNFKNLI